MENKHKAGVFGDDKKDPINMVQRLLTEETDKLEALSAPMRKILARGSISDHDKASKIMNDLAQQQEICFSEYDQLEAMIAVSKKEKKVK